MFPTLEQLRGPDMFFELEIVFGLECHGRMVCLILLLLSVNCPYEKGSCFQASTVETMGTKISLPQLLTKADLIALFKKHCTGQ